MKNFPHQFNDPQKFRDTLEIIRSLAASGGDPHSDSSLGTAMAERGVYSFRGNKTLAENLKAEKAKPRASRGSETAAREARRTLLHFGFVNADLSLSPRGEALRQTAPASSAEQAIWREALLSLALTEGGHTSHPVLVLLRVVRDRAIMSRDGTEVALEAKDDSEAEHRRMLRLVDLAAAERVEQMNTTATSQANARKILPALAESAGLIERQSPQHPYTLTQLGKIAIDASQETAQAQAPPPRRRVRRPREGTFKGARKRVSSSGRPRRPRARRRVQTPEEQAAAEQLLYERTDRHEDLVDCISDKLPGAFTKWEDPFSYDLLADRGGRTDLLLIEAKTLEADEATQVRRAIGQLLFYEGTVVMKDWPGRSVKRIAAFEAAIPTYLAELLDSLSIAAIWCDDSGLRALNDSGENLQRTLSHL